MAGGNFSCVMIANICCLVSEKQIFYRIGSEIVCMKVIKSELNSNVRNRIKDLRIKRNWNQNYVAEKLDISVAAYSKLENGYNDFSLSRINEIASILDLDVVHLIAYCSGSEIRNISVLDQLLKKKDLEIELLKLKIIELERELFELINE
jgi:transcriptional regulator with XRE-family HTH domain